MRTEDIWVVIPSNTPILKRKCNHCNDNRFYCSEKFRVNAQKRNIDVWLIYRCVKCDNTYNMTILSRTKPEMINKDLYRNFLDNHKETAWRYAFSQEIKQKNKVELDLGSVAYDITHNDISIEDILNCTSEIARFKVKCSFDFNLKLSSLIRACLKLSANQLDRIIEAKAISVREKYLQKKHKVKTEDEIQINVEKLKMLYR